MAKLGKVAMGSWFVLLAKSLVEGLGSKDAAGEVFFMVSEVQCLVEPLPAANELHAQGESAALSAGDINFACFNRLMHSVNTFWSGSYLSVVNERIRNACDFLKLHGHKNSLVFMLLMQSTVAVLSGHDSDFQMRNDMLKVIQENANTRLLFTM